MQIIDILEIMDKVIEDQKERGVLVEVCSLEVENGKEEEVPWNMQKFFDEFKDLFATPTELSLNRMNNHSIVLKDCTKLVNVRPYRYPHF